MNRTVALLACCLASLATGCMRGSSASPSPTPTDVGPVLVSVEDVRALSGIPEFQIAPESQRTSPEASPNTPEPCRAVYDQPTVFGTDWTQFRSVVYSATIDDPLIPEIVNVRQTVAVYPDDAAAQATFDRLQAAIPHCAAAHIDYYSRTPQRPDPSTIVFDGEEANYIYRVAQTAVIYASVIGPFNTDDVAHKIADQLAGQRD
ncbi:sensor domain-containing protein [Mycolicibacterium fortuitum]|nr:sensor domain-containing protein [Mycolicibacterium fortuitum]